MLWAVTITAIAGLLSTLLGVIVSYRFSVKTTERQIRAQAEREDVAAGRDYARRADEHFRPHFDTILGAARGIHDACRQDFDHIGDTGALDRCIDHLECSALTRPVAAAAIDLRRAAIEYHSQMGLRAVLRDQMPVAGSGAPLNPMAGLALVTHEDTQLAPARDAVYAAVHQAQEAVKRVVAQLEAEQDAARLRAIG